MKNYKLFLSNESVIFYKQIIYFIEQSSDEMLVSILCILNSSVIS